MWHNESINVWSHLAVAIFLIIFIGVIYSYDSGWKEKALGQIHGIANYLILCFIYNKISFIFLNKRYINLKMRLMLVWRKEFNHYN